MESKTTEDNWKKKLTKEQYKVLRKKGTEPPFTGKFVNHHDEGIYKCAGYAFLHSYNLLVLYV